MGKMSAGLENLYRKHEAANREFEARINEFQHPLDSLLNEMGRVLVEREKVCQRVIDILHASIDKRSLPVEEIVSTIGAGRFSTDQLRKIQEAAFEAQYTVGSRPNIGVNDVLLNDEAVEIRAYSYTQVMVATQREIRKSGDKN